MLSVFCCLLSDCLIIFYYLLLREKKKEPRRSRGTPPRGCDIITLYMIIRWERRNRGSRGTPPRLWKSPPYIILKKYRKPIDKSENVCYNRGKVEAKPSESIKKESGKNRYIIIIKTPKGKE